MKMAIRSCLLALAFIAFPTLARAQVGRVTGTVADSSNSRPVVGARVTVVGTTLTASTGENGTFSLGNVPPGTHQVRIQRIGFSPELRTVTIGAGETANVSVLLTPQAVQLSTVVSIGYGTQLQRDLTGAVSTVTTDAIDKAPISTIDQMLQGTAAGVQVTSSSGEPGGAISIRVRGTSSITGNAEPLYVIDGFPVENDIDASSVGDGGRSRTTPPNPLVAINPSDIESISILKDASATSIYGARGANGVVIITTKQGRGSKPQFSIDSYTGLQSVSKTYDLLNSAEYMDFANEYGKNSSTPFTPFPDDVKAQILASGIDTNWQDQIFRTAGMRNMQVAVRGATSTSAPTRYSLSVGRFDQDGIVLGSGLRRLSGRINLTQSFGSRVQIGGSVAASQARTRSVPTAGQQNANAGAVSAALQYVPILPVKRPDGTYSYINTDLNAYNSTLDAPQTPNPVSLAVEVSDSLSDTRVLGNVFGEANLLPSLKLRLSLGTDYADRWRNTYYPRTTLRGQQSNGAAIRAAAGTSSWVNENTLTWTKSLGSQNIDVLGGFSSQRTDVDGSNIANSNFVSDITGYFDIGSGTQEGGPTISSRHSSQTLESYLSRINYSLLDRYLLTLTYRRDGSSRFAAGKKWGGFPSAALAWRLSEEPFMKHFGAISELKLRTSAGVVGNPSIRPYQSLARLDAHGYSYNGVPYSGYYPVAVGNPNLTWESTHQFDAGVDLGLWNRLTFTADYYRKRTTDLLLLISLPIETGFETALANRGSVENKGVELALDAQILNGGADRGLGWHTNVNFAKNKNKVLSLGGQTSIFADLLTTDYNLPGTMIQVGKPIGVFYGFQSQGVIRDSAAAAAVTWKNFSRSTFKPGDMLITDLDGDGVITLNDRTDIGDPTPDFTYGFTNTFSWRSFEITGLLQGSHGGKILNINRIRTESSPRVNLSRERWYGRWTPTNQDATFPRIGENPNQVGVNNFTSNLLEDGSYLRLRTLTLSYGASWLWGARLYVTGTNLFTKTNYTGFDPDVSAQSVGNTNRGIDIGAYPLARTFITGLTVTY